MFGIHETSGAYIDDSLIAVLATLGSFGKLVDIGLLAIIGFSMFRCEKITVLVKGKIAMIFDQSLQAYLHEGYFTDEEATEKLGKPIIESERQTVTFCDQTFDDIHIFSFDYQGQDFEILENFAIDG